MKALFALMLAVMSLATAAGAQTPRGLVLQAQPDASPLPPLSPARPGAPADPRAFQPAPTPNRDLYEPLGPRASNSPELGPGVFTRKDTYRGEAMTQGSSNETSVDRRAHPAPGFSLRMPLQQD